MATIRSGIQTKGISDWRVSGHASRELSLCRNNRPTISGLHPSAHERYGLE